jgi:hypothetical protein
VERTSRNVITVLAKLGLAISHTSMHGLKVKIALQCIEEARLISMGPYSIGWDNIQCSTSIFVEQRLLGPPKVQSGTAATLYELRDTL